MKGFSSILFLFILLASKPVIGETVVVKGEAPAYADSEARLIVYEDYLTQKEKVLSKQEVRYNGKFKFEIDLPEIREAWIKIDGVTAKIFLQPGNTYNVHFPELPEEQARSFGNPGKVELTFKGLTENDVNTLVIDLNLLYEHFFVRNYQAIAKKRRSGNSSYIKARGKKSQQKELDSATRASINNAPKLEVLLDSFKTDLEERYSDVENPYFDIHYKYLIARLDQLVIRSRKIMADRYFKNTPVHYKVGEYMNFFFDFYEDELINVAFKSATFNLKKTINQKESLTLLLEQLRTDSSIYGRRSRELILMDGLVELYYRSSYSQESVMVIMDSLAQTSPYEENKAIARNIIKGVNQFKKGNEAPNLELLNRDTSLVTLDDLREKPIYLSFFATWSKKSRSELNIMKQFHEKYQKTINFVSICVDEEMEAMTDFLQNHPEYDWTFLHLGGKEDLKKAYEVYSIPTFFLIDPDGKFLRAPAFPPSGKGENDLYKIHQQTKKNKKIKVWDD